MVEYSINKEEFIKILKEQQAQSKSIDIITECGLPLIGSNIIEYGTLMFERVIDAYFTEKGADYIFWWIYEKSEDVATFDEIPIETMDDLWKLVKQYRKLISND